MVYSVDVLQQKSTSQLELMAEIASMYYEQNLTQEEIAGQFFISRSKVSRLLTLAKEKGIVTFNIRHFGQRSYELEAYLKRKFGLTDAFVLNSYNFDYTQVLQLMGEFAASYINRQLKKNQVVGISWGKSITQTINALETDLSLQLEVVQIIGGILTQNPVIHIPLLMQKMVEKFNGKANYLNAPLYMNDQQACTLFKEQPTIAYTLNKARHADMIITGIGEVCAETFDYMMSGSDNSTELELLIKSGAVGFIAAQAYDLQGKECYPEYNKKIIAITLDELKKTKNVVAISGGKRKASAVLGALRGGYVDVLVTDQHCVHEMVRIEKYGDQVTI